jgi:hypothetical protein
MEYTKENRTTIAESAIELLKDGIESGNKNKILKAYGMVEDESFSWEDLDVIYDHWDELVDQANDIIYS